MLCNECRNTVRFYVRVNVGPFDFRPLCLPCAQHLGWLANGMRIHEAEVVGTCGRCGGRGAAGAAGLCQDCNDLADMPCVHCERVDGHSRHCADYPEPDPDKQRDDALEADRQEREDEERQHGKR